MFMLGCFRMNEGNLGPSHFDAKDGAQWSDSRCDFADFGASCESARGPDADRHVKLLIQFAVEGSLSGAYSQDRLALPLFELRASDF